LGYNDCFPILVFYLTYECESTQKKQAGMPAVFVMLVWSQANSLNL